MLGDPIRNHRFHLLTASIISQIVYNTTRKTLQTYIFPARLNTTLIRFFKGRNFSGIEKYVFLPIITTFCLPSTAVNVRVLNNCMSLLQWMTYFYKNKTNTSLWDVDGIGEYFLIYKLFRDPVSTGAGIIKTSINKLYTPHPVNI